MHHEMAEWRLVIVIVVIAAITGCDRRIYVQDGVTDGDRFSVPPYAYASSDPVLQSWVAYGLARSVCQLEIGGPNPARNQAFECELVAREALIARWQQSPSLADPYLEQLSVTAEAGYLEEYVWHYLRRREWTRPDDLDLAGFTAWRNEALPRRHRPETRIIGSWGYAATLP